MKYVIFEAICGAAMLGLSAAVFRKYSISGSLWDLGAAFFALIVAGFCFYWAYDILAQHKELDKLEKEVEEIKKEIRKMEEHSKWIETMEERIETREKNIKE